MARLTRKEFLRTSAGGAAVLAALGLGQQVLGTNPANAAGDAIMAKAFGILSAPAVDGTVIRVAVDASLMGTREQNAGIVVLTLDPNTFPLEAVLAEFTLGHLLGRMTLNKLSAAGLSAIANNPNNRGVPLQLEADTVTGDITFTIGPGGGFAQPATFSGKGLVVVA